MFLKTLMSICLCAHRLKAVLTIFLAVNLKATHQRDFFKRQNIGKNSFLSIVKNACNAEGIQGSRRKSWITTHGLRGTLATLLFEIWHSDSSIVLRTGHRHPKSLKSYQPLRGVEGIQQQRDVLGGAALDPSAKRTKVDLDTKQRDAMAHVGPVSGGTVNVTVNY